MTTHRYRLSVDQIYHRCDPAQFSFETTASLQSCRQSIGQERALDSINFGIDIKRHGYNIFAIGPNGAGKYTLIRDTLKQHTIESNECIDWAYLNNFTQSYQPIAIKLPNGVGNKLRKDLLELTANFTDIIPRAFEAENYNKMLLTISSEYQQRENSAFDAIENEAKELGLNFIQTETDFSFSPIPNPSEADKTDDNDTIQDEDYRSHTQTLQQKLQNTLQQLPIWQQESRNKIQELNTSIAQKTIGFWISNLKHTYKEFNAVCSHLSAIEENIIENVAVFLPQSNNEAVQQTTDIKSLLASYQLNLIVEYDKSECPPIVYEVNPTLENMIGKIDSINHYGTQTSDFTQIKAGALHKANGGYLILDAYKLLDKPYSWEALKRALASGEINIEKESDGGSLSSSNSVSPEPIPLDIKIILLGDYHEYFTLYEIDPEFNTLFKVVADFEDSVSRTPESCQQYAELINTIIKRHNLKAFHKTAVARVIEESSLWIEDATRLSTHTGELQDLITEAEYWAIQNKQKSVTAANVESALFEKDQRISRLKRHSLDAIQRGTTIIQTEGETVGQINGLTISDLGEFTFGQPSRITAVARLGDGKIIDIEHEANLGGSIHTKGLLILSHFFGKRYLKHKNLSFTASIVFEQSYGQIDGDSASAAELVALLSAISEIPIKQSLAITGAIDQMGNMLPIGGVNLKVESFFDVCKERGLNSHQGVIIPKKNKHQLMLNSEIVDAVTNDLFHIYAIDHIDQAIELLTDFQIGKRDDNNIFTEDSFNSFVEQKLYELATLGDDSDD